MNLSDQIFLQALQDKSNFESGICVPSWVIGIIATEGINKVFEFWRHFLLGVCRMCAVMHTFSSEYMLCGKGMSYVADW